MGPAGIGPRPLTLIRLARAPGSGGDTLRAFAGRSFDETIGQLGKRADRREQRQREEIGLHRPIEPVEHVAAEQRLDPRQAGFRAGQERSVDG